MRANFVGNSVVSAITQTPASGPDAPTTVPPMSVVRSLRPATHKLRLGLYPAPPSSRQISSTAQVLWSRTWLACRHGTGSLASFSLSVGNFQWPESLLY